MSCDKLRRASATSVMGSCMKMKRLGTKFKVSPNRKHVSFQCDCYILVYNTCANEKIRPTPRLFCLGNESPFLRFRAHSLSSDDTLNVKIEPQHDKINTMTCAPSEDSDKPGHPPSPIRVFAVRMKKPWSLSYPLSAQRRLWLNWADAQADLRVRWARN